MTIFQGRAVKLRGYPQKDGLEKVVPFKYDLFLVSIACNFCGVYYTHTYIYISVTVCMSCGLPRFIFRAFARITSFCGDPN